MKWRRCWNVYELYYKFKDSVENNLSIKTNFSMGEDSSPESIQELITQLDRNADGKVVF